MDFRPRFSTDDLDGVYRLVWGVYVPVSGGHPDQLIPIEFRVSNRFLLRMPD